MTLLTLFYLLIGRPLKDKSANTVEVINEVTTLLLSCIVFCFSNVLVDNEAKYNLGWAFIGIFLLNFVYNLVLLVIGIIHSYYVLGKMIIKRIRNKSKNKNIVKPIDQ